MRDTRKISIGERRIEVAETEKKNKRKEGNVPTSITSVIDTRMRLLDKSNLFRFELSVTSVTTSESRQGWKWYGIARKSSLPINPCGTVGSVKLASRLFPLFHKYPCPNHNARASDWCIVLQIYLSLFLFLLFFYAACNAVYTHTP